MIQVDVTGFDKMLKYIEAAKKSKFTIYRYGQTSANIPVFECLSHTNVQNAIQEFRAWAELANASAVYKIILFDIVEASETGGLKKTQNKTGKMEAVFTLGTEAPVNYSGGTGTSGLDISAVRAEIKRELEAEHEKVSLADEIKKLRTEIELMKSEEVEYEEEESGLFGVSPSQIQQMQMLIAALKGSPMPAASAPAINGPETATVSKEDRVKSLNDSIKRLYKVDKDFHQDLALLADIAEQKPETFNYLLTMLRGGSL